MKYSEIKFILQQLEVYGWKREHYPKSMKTHGSHGFYRIYEVREYKYRASIPLRHLISLAKIHNLDFIPDFLRYEADRCWLKITGTYLEQQNKDYQLFLQEMEREKHGEAKRKS